MADAPAEYFMLTDKAINGNPSEDIYNAVGRLNTGNMKPTASRFWLETDVCSGTNIWAGAFEGIAMKSTANYTLVDYTDDINSPVISKRTIMPALFDSKYISYVFVRVYDDTLSEVVVYRFNDDKN